MSFTIDESQQASVDDIHVVKDLLECFAQARCICDKAGANDLEVHILAAVALLQSLRAAAALELFGGGRQNRSDPKQNCLRGLVCQGSLGWQDHCHRKVKCGWCAESVPPPFSRRALSNPRTDLSCWYWPKVTRQVLAFLQDTHTSGS